MDIDVPDGQGLLLQFIHVCDVADEVVELVEELLKLDRIVDAFAKLPLTPPVCNRELEQIFPVVAHLSEVALGAWPA
jgi:hypothetical protein